MNPAYSMHHPTIVIIVGALRRRPHCAIELADLLRVHRHTAATALSWLRKKKKIYIAVRQHRQGENRKFYALGHPNRDVIRLKNFTRAEHSKRERMGYQSDKSDRARNMNPPRRKYTVAING